MTEHDSPNQTPDFSFPEGEDGWRARLIQIHKPQIGLVLLAIFIASTFAVYWNAVSNEDKRAQLRFANRLAATETQLHDLIMRYRHGLQFVSGYYGASQLVERDEWSVYVKATNLSARMPGLETSGLIRWVPQGQWQSYAQELADEGLDGVVPRQIHPSSDAAVFHYIEPLSKDALALIGSDIYFNQSFNAALNLAKKMDDLVLLATPGGSGPAHARLYAFLPLHKYNETNQYFLGWIFLEFDTHKMLKPFLEPMEQGGELRIINKLANGSAWDIYQTQSSSYEPSQLTYNASTELQLFNLNWQIEFAGDEQYWRAQESTNLPFYVLLVGALVNGLLMYVLFSSHVINRYLRVESIRRKRKYEGFLHSLTMQARLVEEVEREAEALYEMAPDALIVVNPEGEIVKANETAHDMFLVNQGELVGTKVESLIPEGMREQHVALRSNYFKSPERRDMAVNQSLQAVRFNGDAFPIAINLMPIKFRDQTHTLASVHDLSERIAFEQSLEEEKVKAESNSNAKSEFVANMSHEIRTPLNAVLGSAQLLARTELNKKQASFVSMIKSSGEALLGVINDILDFSKIEAGKMELTQVSFDLQELVNRVAVMMSVNLGEKDLELVIDIDGDVPLQLVGDPLRLQQVLINLVSNALKFTEKGQVVLSIDTCGEKEGGLQPLSFQVKDTGIGMDQQQQTKLFQAFSQADTSISRRFGGTGLGLIISNNIVSLMGGKISVTSELNVGSVFKFKILMPVVAKQGSTLLPNVHDVSVAIIEHRPQTLGSIEKLIMRWGWNWAHFETLAEYRDAYNKNPKLHQHDFILTSWALCTFDQEAFSDLRHRRICPADAGVICYFSNNEQLNSHLYDGDSRFDSAITQPLVAVNVLDAFNCSAQKRQGKSIVTALKNIENNNKIDSALHVLLVEDNPLNQTIAISMLEDMGISVSTVNSGLEAVEFIRNSDIKISMIFMDIQMPVMDGVTATKILRNDLQCTLPIIAMTAGVLKSEREEYLASGMNDLVPKPIDASELFKAIKKALPEVEISTDTMNQESDNSDVFDRQRLEALAKGKERRIRTICDALEKLCYEGEAQVKLAMTRLSEGDETNAKFLVHGMKGVAGNYGAVTLHKSLESLEALIIRHEEKNKLELGEREVVANFREFSKLALPWCEQQLSVFENVQSANEATETLNFESFDVPKVMCQSLVNAANLNNITQLEAGLSELSELGDQAKKLADLLNHHLEQFETQKIVDVLGRVSQRD